MGGFGFGHGDRELEGKEGVILFSNTQTTGRFFG